ncbi:MAG: alpha/beta fold hydrolase [Calditrichia bacterium]
MKFLIRILSVLLPGFTVKLAYKSLTSPQVRKLRERELAVLDKAKRETLPFKDFDIQLYEWTGGPDTVLLVHGWEGQAGNFSDLVERLLEKNYTVIAFDGPSHGFSSGGKTSLFEFTELVSDLLARYKMNKIISHSFGGVATAFALHSNPDIEIEKYCLLTTPDRFLDRIEDVAKQVGITENVKQRLIKRLEEETGIPAASMNVSDYLKTANVKQALIIHDKDDQVIPIEISRHIQQGWPVCDIDEVEGTGHFRMLRTDFVLDRVVTFLE